MEMVGNFKHLTAMSLANLTEVLNPSLIDTKSHEDSKLGHTHPHEQYNSISVTDVQLFPLVANSPNSKHEATSVQQQDEPLDQECCSVTVEEHMSSTLQDAHPPDGSQHPHYESETPQDLAPNKRSVTYPVESHEFVIARPDLPPSKAIQTLCGDNDSRMNGVSTSISNEWMTPCERRTTDDQGCTDLELPKNRIVRWMASLVLEALASAIEEAREDSKENERPCNCDLRRLRNAFEKIMTEAGALMSPELLPADIFFILSVADAVIMQIPAAKKALFTEDWCDTAMNPFRFFCNHIGKWRSHHKDQHMTTKDPKPNEENCTLSEGDDSELLLIAWMLEDCVVSPDGSNNDSYVSGAPIYKFLLDQLIGKDNGILLGLAAKWVHRPQNFWSKAKDKSTVQKEDLLRFLGTWIEEAHFLHQKLIENDKTEEHRTASEEGLTAESGLCQDTARCTVAQSVSVNITTLSPTVREVGANTSCIAEDLLAGCTDVDDGTDEQYLISSFLKRKLAASTRLQYENSANGAWKAREADGNKRIWGEADKYLSRVPCDEQPCNVPDLESPLPARRQTSDLRTESSGCSVDLQLVSLSPRQSWSDEGTPSSFTSERSPSVHVQSDSDLPEQQPSPHENVSGKLRQANRALSTALARHVAQGKRPLVPLPQHIVKRQKRRGWTRAEEIDLVERVNRVGTSWAMIAAEMDTDRTQVNLKDKWRNLLQYGHVKWLQSENKFIFVEK